MQNEVRKCPYCSKSYKFKDYEILRKIRHIPVPDCSCEKEAAERAEKEKTANELQKKINNLFDFSMLTPRFKARTFYNWQCMQGTEKAYHAVRFLIDNWAVTQKTGQGVLLIGPPGVGKTHLAAAVINELIEKLIPCLFFSVSELLVRVETSYSGSSNFSLDKVFTMIKQAQLIVMDDLGKEKYTEKRFETIYNLVNVIYEHEKPIIITMNPESNDKMSKHPELVSIIDRCIEMCAKQIIEVKDVSSYREKIAEGGKQN